MIPKHVAIIMDGNRRWARSQNLKDWFIAGHRRASDQTLEPLVDAAISVGIEYLTLWAFSTENWQRAKAEIEGLMALFRKYLHEDVERLHRKGVRLKVIGDITKFPSDIQEGIARGLALTEGNRKITVILALNYGGRDEIMRAVNKMLEAGSFKLEADEEEFNKYLDTAGIPEPDLIIRTGGAVRTSGFLPWQSAYSEWYFTKTYFPDFTPGKFREALEDYQNRKRNFGR